MDVADRKVRWSDDSRCLILHPGSSRACADPWCDDAHSQLEVHYHPDRYKCDKCTKGDKCVFLETPDRCPYAHSIHDRRDPHLRVCTVDQAQGSEADVVILTMVRCNTRGDVGFCSKWERSCVAMSRASSIMYVVGNKATFALRGSFNDEPNKWRDVVEYDSVPGIFREPTVRGL